MTVIGETVENYIFLCPEVFNKLGRGPDPRSLPLLRPVATLPPVLSRNRPDLQKSSAKTTLGIFPILALQRLGCTFPGEVLGLFFKYRPEKVKNTTLQIWI